ncbi:MAG: hypothetical protein U0T81_08895 [Saprospiraceae bacterium]
MTKNVKKLDKDCDQSIDNCIQLNDTSYLTIFINYRGHPSTNRRGFLAFDYYIFLTIIGLKQEKINLIFYLPKFAKGSNIRKQIGTIFKGWASFNNKIYFIFM